jgi:hypothetical protein
MKAKPRTPKIFDPDTALKAARGFHGAAGLLENAHNANVERMQRHPTGEVHSPLEDTFVAAAVLEALALELVLKTRLYRAGIPFEKIHELNELYAQVPAAERQTAEQRYKEFRHPAMRATLDDVLKFHGSVFETWRYPHEQPRLEMSMGELRKAFRALTEGL